MRKIGQPNQKSTVYLYTISMHYIYTLYLHTISMHYVYTLYLSIHYVYLYTIAGPAINPVQGFRTCRDLHWEFLRLWTDFELPSSWPVLPCYGPNLNRNILDFMRWPQIDLGTQDLNGFNGHNTGSKVLDEYYVIHTTPT
jgi:hypothetical protein